MNRLPTHAQAHGAVWALILTMMLAPSIARAELDVEVGSRPVDGGEALDYMLFVPAGADQLAEAPFPVLVLTHGFARDYGRQVANAAVYAQEGIIVMIPNAATRAGGVELRHREVVERTVGHVDWLIERGNDQDDKLFGLVDNGRIALAGHSAGGAISLEAARDLQAAGRPPAALVLLDAVPYNSTIDDAGTLDPLPMLSLRSEPHPCNSDGSVGEVIAALSFPIEDILIEGATHCDPESPTDITCAIACGRSDGDQAATYTELTGGFLREQLVHGDISPAFD